MKGKAKPDPDRVRCLGPGPEHFFVSSNRTHHRICGKCADKAKRYGVARMETPVKAHDPSGRT